MPKAVDAMLIKKNICSRIIWRTWGHDQIFLVNSNPIKNILKRCILRLLPKKINSFYAVGIANLVDSLSINENFGNNKMYYLPYNLCENNYGKKNIHNSKCTKILLGHSGFSINHHINILKKLEKYESNNILINIVLSYGDQNYIEEVKNYISFDCSKLLKGKIRIITDKMTLPEYVDFINSNDIIVLDGKSSYALGNLGIALNQGKKLYVNFDGIIHRALDSENIPNYNVNCIGKESFESFATSEHYNLDNSSFKSKSESEKVSLWKNLLLDLDSEKMLGVINDN